MSRGGPQLYKHFYIFSFKPIKVEKRNRVTIFVFFLQNFRLFWPVLRTVNLKKVCVLSYDEEKIIKYGVTTESETLKQLSNSRN